MDLQKDEVAMSEEVNIKQKGIRMTNSGLKVPGINAAVSPNTDLPHLTFSILVLLISITSTSLINF